MAARKKDYSELLRDGLSTHRTYILLKQKSRSPVELRFRPFMHRISGISVYVGGKLSSFIDATHEKVQGMTNRERTELMKTAWRKLPQDRVGPVRIGSNAGFYVLGGSKDQKKFETKFDKAHMIKALLDGIENELKIEIDNRPEVTAFLSEFYHNGMSYTFNNEYGDSIPERQIGKKSDLMLGQSYINGGAEYAEFLGSTGLKSKAA